MEVPFPSTAWQPSRSLPFHALPQNIEKWSQSLAALTKKLLAYPYDPSGWLQRGWILQKLQYPELAVGDAWKAQCLCQSLLSRLEQSRSGRADGGGRPRLGFNCGFWMLDDEEGLEETNEAEEEWELAVYRFRAFNREALAIMQGNLTNGQQERCEMGYIPRLYPWTPARYRTRNDEVVRRIDDEFDALSGGWCGVRRHAFGKTLDDNGKTCTDDVLGVFAKQKIPAGELVLEDWTSLWGCHDAPVLQWKGCKVASHPGWDEDDDREDEGGRDREQQEKGGLQWVRERCGVDSASVIVLIKVLLQCCLPITQHEGTRVAPPNGSSVISRMHPLDHSVISRLTASYRNRMLAQRRFNIELDLESPCMALQQYGKVDIFADHRFDTWALLTVSARMDNNATSSLGMMAVFPLFSLFNHDCDPNVNWQASNSYEPDEVETRHGKVIMVAARDIEAGEQLCVSYNTYSDDQPVQDRQKGLTQWLENGCKCNKCERESSWRWRAA